MELISSGELPRKPFVFKSMPENPGREDFAFASTVNIIGEGIIPLINYCEEFRPDALVFLDMSGRDLGRIYNFVRSILFPAEKGPDLRYLNLGREINEDDSYAAKLKSMQVQAAEEGTLVNRFANTINGKRVVIVDDLVSTGGTYRHSEEVFQNVFHPDQVSFLPILRRPIRLAQDAHELGIVERVTVTDNNIFASDPFTISYESFANETAPRRELEERQKQLSEAQAKHRPTKGIKEDIRNLVQRIDPNVVYSEPAHSMVPIRPGSRAEHMQRLQLIAQAIATNTQRSVPS